MLKGNDVKKLIIKAMPELKVNDISVSVKKNYQSYNIRIKKIVPLSKVKKAVEELRQTTARSNAKTGFLFIEFSGWDSWDTNKRVRYPIEIKENIKTAIKNVAKNIKDDGSMLVYDKFKYIAKILLDSQSFKKDYTKSDIYKVVELVYESDEEIKKMIGKDPM